MNNNELENIETIDLGGNTNTTIEPVVTAEPAAEEALVQNVSAMPEAPVANETVEPIVNPQANVLSQIQTDVINSESNSEAQISTTNNETKNPESLGTITTEEGEKVEIVPVDEKSLKDTFVPLALLAVGLLAFILLIPKLSEIFNGM